MLKIMIEPTICWELLRRAMAKRSFPSFWSSMQRVRWFSLTVILRWRVSGVLWSWAVRMKCMIFLVLIFFDCTLLWWCAANLFSSVVFAWVASYFFS